MDKAISVFADLMNDLIEVIDTPVVFWGATLWDIILAMIIIAAVISVFWKGARA